ncbi:MAG: glutamine--fructose-6-phosphate transaminase (isomerizing) [bacterium]|nr:glutamine--fructose-6-phosphate transaminase (isomerizing) [bacterium]
MCGIFGYVGELENSPSVILEGLKLLEYRGYDSWGIAVGNDRHIVCEKQVGKIGNAVLKSDVLNLKSNIGIGHTRWATHGMVTDANAHPHLSCDRQIAVVHNGIVENFNSLKKKLEKKHEFYSDTDTEVIAHLIEQELKTKPLKEAVVSAFKKLKGLNAIAVLSQEGEIVVAKNGSPLVLGAGDSSYYVASDPSALISYTKKAIFIEDQQLAVLNKKGIQVFSLENGKKVASKIQTLQGEVADTLPGEYAHFMLKEINEQPKVIRSVVEVLTDSAVDMAREIKAARGTFFIASGTAFHACLAGTYLFSKIAGHHVNTSVASEFNYLEDFLNPKSLVIALSQSGETIDVVEPLNRAAKKGAKIAAVVNNLGSTIYRMGDIKVLLGAGPEIAVASTKAYVAKIAFLLLVAYSLVGKTSTAKRLLRQSANEIERLLRKSDLEKIKKTAKFLAKAEHIYTIGRGLSYSTALESALKIKEVSYIHTEGLAGGELKHGTIALVSRGTPCLVYAPSDETYEAIISNATEIKSRGGFIIGIGSKKADVFDEWIEVKDTGDASLISMVVPAQLLAYYLALEKGADPDKPRNLAKSVTVK